MLKQAQQEKVDEITSIMNAFVEEGTRQYREKIGDKLTIDPGYALDYAKSCAKMYAAKTLAAGIEGGAADVAMAIKISR